MQKLKIIDDLIYNIDGDNLILIEDKRWDGINIVDPHNFTQFYIDNNGIKHISPNENYQPLKCNFDDIILFDSTLIKWRVATEEEKENILLNQKIKKLSEFTKDYILNFYPLIKQNSDLYDINYYKPILSQKYENLDKMINDKVNSFCGGANFNDLFEDVNDEDVEGFKQLLKAFIRIRWLNECKETYKKLIYDDSLLLPPYPTFD